jgi:hypothetical protein
LFALHYYLSSKYKVKNLKNLQGFSFFFFKTKKVFYNTFLKKKIRFFKKSFFFKCYGFKWHFSRFLFCLMGVNESFFNQKKKNKIFFKYANFLKIKHKVLFFFNSIKQHLFFYKNLKNRFHFILIKNARLLKNWFILFKLPLNGQRTKTNCATAARMLYKRRTYFKPLFGNALLETSLLKL